MSTKFTNVQACLTTLCAISLLSFSVSGFTQWPPWWFPVLQAKRLPPVKIPSVHLSGLRFTLKQRVEYDPENLCTKGALLEIEDMNTEKLVKSFYVFGSSFDPGLESDVQDIHAESMVVDGEKIVITSERSLRSPDGEQETAIIDTSNNFELRSTSPPCKSSGSKPRAGMENGASKEKQDQTAHDSFFSSPFE